MVCVPVTFQSGLPLGIDAIARYRDPRPIDFQFEKDVLQQLEIIDKEEGKGAASMTNVAAAQKAARVRRVVIVITISGEGSGRAVGKRDRRAGTGRCGTSGGREGSCRTGRRGKSGSGKSGSGTSGSGKSGSGTSGSGTGGSGKSSGRKGSRRERSR